MGKKVKVVKVMELQRMLTSVATSFYESSNKSRPADGSICLFSEKERAKADLALSIAENINGYAIEIEIKETT